MDERTKVGTLLHREHVKTLDAMENLESFLQMHSRRDPPKPGNAETTKILQSLLGDLAGEMGRHFSFEENWLFPLLSERGHSGIVAMLTEEHEIIRPLARVLARGAATALAGAGFLPQGWQEFHDRASELCERETFHIQKEETGLIGALPFLLDADTDTRLAELYVAEAC